MNPLNMTGRCVLVTGASSGIGRETATLLSQLGASLVLNGRNRSQLERTLTGLEGTGHRIAEFDLANLDEIPGWVKALAERTPFHGVVHCAGIHSALPLQFLKSAALDEMMRVNFHSAVMLARGFRQKGCHSAGDASLVFVSSVAGIVGEGSLTAYSASKAAIDGATRSLAIELAPQGIRVNGVAPGFVETEMAARLREKLTTEQFSAIEQKHPLGIGRPRDVANGIAFLLAGASRWITGTTLVIDGGYTAH